MKRHILVYGTLRPGNTETVKIDGFDMYDLGWFPGIVKGEGSVVCERIEVKDDNHLKALDRYEGYREDNKEGSLYTREKVGEDFIYVYNRKPSGEGKTVEGGDWLEYRNEERGRNAALAVD